MYEVCLCVVCTRSYIHQCALDARENKAQGIAYDRYLWALDLSGRHLGPRYPLYSILPLAILQAWC